MAPIRRISHWPNVRPVIHEFQIATPVPSDAEHDERLSHRYTGMPPSCGS